MLGSVGMTEEEEEEEEVGGRTTSSYTAMFAVWRGDPENQSIIKNYLKENQSPNEKPVIHPLLDFLHL